MKLEDRISRIFTAWRQIAETLKAPSPAIHKMRFILLAIRARDATAKREI